MWDKSWGQSAASSVKRQELLLVAQTHVLNWWELVVGCCKVVIYHKLWEEEVPVHGRPHVSSWQVKDVQLNVTNTKGYGAASLVQGLLPCSQCNLQFSSTHLSLCVLDEWRVLTHHPMEHDLGSVNCTFDGEEVMVKWRTKTLNHGPSPHC